MPEKHLLTGMFHGIDVHKCYQCGKCTAGCTVSDSMDFTPNQIMRLIQAGSIDKAMRCAAIWHCLSCQTCSARCPQGVDVAGAIDRLKELSVKKRTVARGLHRVAAFQQAFLENIRRHGRVNEVELIGEFKTRSFLKDFNVMFLMKDAMLAPKLMQREKFHLVGEQVRDRDLVKRIFDRCTSDGQQGEH